MTALIASLDSQSTVTIWHSGAASFRCLCQISTCWMSFTASTSLSAATVEKDPAIQGILESSAHRDVLRLQLRGGFRRRLDMRTITARLRTNFVVVSQAFRMIAQDPEKCSDCFQCRTKLTGIADEILPVQVGTSIPALSALCTSQALQHVSLCGGLPFASLLNSIQ